MKTLLITLSLLAILPNAYAAEKKGPGHGVGPAHPSAYLCNELKGQTINVTSSRGEFALCKLGDAETSIMNLWYSLKGNLEKSYETFLNHPEAQGPAARNPEDYCRFVGGSIEVVSVRGKNRKIKICKFDDNGHSSSIGLVTLFRGPAHPGNARLVEVLKSKK